jgi:hypothetical protein
LTTNAAYLANWIKARKGDARLAIQAGTAVQKAVDYVLNRKPDTDCEGDESKRDNSNPIQKTASRSWRIKRYVWSEGMDSRSCWRVRAVIEWAVTLRPSNTHVRARAAGHDRKSRDCPP